MTGFDLAIIVAVPLIAWGAYRWACRMERREDRLVERSLRVADEDQALRDMRLLIDVTPRGTLVTPRGIELPCHPAWSDLDVILTLADVEALG